MTQGGSRGPVFSVEDFVQSLTAQLDKAQDALAIKAKTGRPLTFALKDLSVDLKVFWEAPEGQLKLRHANPNEEGASTVHLSFTTITRAMAEENSLSLGMDEDPRSLSEITADGSLGEEERRKLELAGVRTVGQFRKLSENTDPKQVEAYLGIPVNRLRMALQRSAQPAVIHQESIRSPDNRRLLRIRGANLMKGQTPRVMMSGEPVEVLEASPTQLLVQPMAHHNEGYFEIDVEGERTEGFYRLNNDGSNKQTHHTLETRPTIPQSHHDAQSYSGRYPSGNPNGSPHGNPGHTPNHAPNYGYANTEQHENEGFSKQAQQPRGEQLWSL